MGTSERWVAAQWVLVGLLGVSLFTPRSAELSWARAPGLVLAGLGVGIVGWSAYSYAKVNRSLFHVSPEPDKAGQLVDSGIYSHVRHPVYSGVISGAFGLALFHGGFWSLAAAGILSVFYYMKSRYEDELLIRVFPGYEAYRERTGRFVPGAR